MDCSEVERRVADDGSLDDPSVAAHLAGCEACAGLVGGGADLARGLGGLRAFAAPPLGDLEKQVGAAIARDRGVAGDLRALPRASRLGFVVALLGLDALVFAVFFLRRDWDTLPMARMALLLGAQGIFAVGLMWEAMRPIYRPARPDGFVGVLLVGAALLPVLVALLPELPTSFEYRFVQQGLACFALGVAQGLALVLLARFLDRGGVRGQALLLAAVAGGLLGQIGLTLECPINHADHLLAGHATVPLGLLLGVLIARRTSRQGD